MRQNLTLFSPNAKAKRRGLPRPLERQTVSKPRFWSLLTFQTIDFVRPHFRKNEF
jgi:hypothetical protein